MVSQRQRQDVEYLVIKVRGREEATSSELDDIEDRYSQVEEETASRARETEEEERAVVMDGEINGMEKDGEGTDEGGKEAGQAKAKTT